MDPPLPVVDLAILDLALMVLFVALDTHLGSDELLTRYRAEEWLRVLSYGQASD